LILTEYPQLQMESLFDGFDQPLSWHRLFAHDYVVAKRINDNLSVSEQGAIQAFLDSPPRLFTETFELETSYLLPDGETVYLYRQRFPLPADYPVEQVFSLAERLTGQTRAGDAILLTAPELMAPFVSHYSGPAEIYLVPETEEEMGEMLAQHSRTFLLIDDLADQGARARAQDWLNRYGFWAAHEWVGGLQLVTYGTVPGSPIVVPTVDVSATLGNQIELEGYDLSQRIWAPGEIISLTLFWKPEETLATDYRVFVHLLNDAGQPVAQTDTAPVGGSRPTTTWRAGEEVRDPIGLLLPPSLAEGEYRLVVGLYSPGTGERLVVQTEAGTATGDSIPLGTIRVRQP